MTDALSLNRTTAKPSPTKAEAVEAAKTEAQKAADVTYTLNHAFACMGTDVFVQPIVGDLTHKYLDYRVNVGCTNPEHNHAQASIYDFFRNLFKPKTYKPLSEHQIEKRLQPLASNLPKKKESYGLNYLIGEFVGDVLAVPVAIWLQRHAPKAMHVLRQIVEPVFRPLFKFGTDRAAAKWAWQHGLASFSPEAKAKAEAMYEHEASHLPQAVTWTLGSIGISILTQKFVAKLEGKEMAAGDILRGKLNGSVASALILLAFRGVLPKKAEQMDQFTSQKIFLPATKKAGSLFGVKHADAEKALAEEPETPVLSWSEKILAAPLSTGLEKR